MEMATAFLRHDNHDDVDCALYIGSGNGRIADEVVTVGCGVRTVRNRSSNTSHNNSSK